MAKVGLACNIIRPEHIKDLPLDWIAELDSDETIQDIANALRSVGHEVILLEADEEFPFKLRAANPDVVFNIAEGVQGDCRESQVPAVCDFMDIPYTGSGVLSLSICQNKTTTNEVLAASGVRVPPFQVFHSSEDDLRMKADFPLIVKLVHEGSSMGLTRNSVVENEAELRNQVRELINSFRQAALVEKFILGREFTVGILGNQDLLVLPITEITFQDRYGIVTFSPNEEVIPMIEQVRGKEYLENFMSQMIPHQSVCPAEISSELADRIDQTAVKAFRALQCRDWCRVDLRLGSDDQLYVFDVNPIAGIAPGYWIPNSAEAINLSYASFINKILDIALERIKDEHQA